MYTVVNIKPINICYSPLSVIHYCAYLEIYTVKNVSCLRFNRLELYV